MGTYLQQQQRQREISKKISNNNNNDAGVAATTLDIENGNNRDTEQRDFDTNETDIDVEGGILSTRIDGVDFAHNVNGTIYTNVNLTTNKIRITENPLPDPVSC